MMEAISREGRKKQAVPSLAKSSKTGSNSSNLAISKTGSNSSNLAKWKERHVEDKQVHQSLSKRNKSSLHDRDNDAERGDGITSSIVMRKRKTIQQDMSTLTSLFKPRTRAASQDLSTLESTVGMDDDTIPLQYYDDAANFFDEAFEEEDIEEQASDDDSSYRHSDGGGLEEEEEAEQEEAAASGEDEPEDDREIEPGLIDLLVGKCDVM